MERTGETTEEHWSDVYNRFVQETGLMGTAYIGSVISREDLEQWRFGQVKRLFAESACRKGTARAAGEYAVCYHRGSYDSLPAVYPLLLKEIQRLGYSVAGDAYEEYLIAETAAKCQDKFITKISIPTKRMT